MKIRDFWVNINFTAYVKCYNANLIEIWMLVLTADFKIKSIPHNIGSKIYVDNQVWMQKKIAFFRTQVDNAFLDVKENLEDVPRSLKKDGRAKKEGGDSSSDGVGEGELDEEAAKTVVSGSINSTMSSLYGAKAANRETNSRCVGLSQLFDTHFPTIL